MTSGVEAIRWAPRVRRSTIRRLYEQDARGIVDEELIDEVAFAFYARCKAILTATAAWYGTAACPRCEREIAHGHDPREVLRCEPCAWETTWIEYRRSFRSKQLIGGYARPWFEQYTVRLPAARTPRERMLLIDWMVHRLHNALPTGGEAPIGRPAAVNMIGGTLSQVAAMLDELAEVPGSRIGPADSHRAWRARTWLPPPEAVAAAEHERRAKRERKRSNSDSRAAAGGEPSPPARGSSGLRADTRALPRSRPPSTPR